MVKESIILVALTIFSIQDIKRKRIHSLSVFTFLFIGILFLFFSEETGLLNPLGGVCLGLVMFGISWITGEALGYGDGWIFLTTGIYLGAQKNFQLFVTSTFIACAFSIIQMIFGRKGAKDEIPFVPFIWMAYMIHIGGSCYERIV
ncbi:MAG: hypothetical protein HFI37_01460 [Lachnospiraceae bacterium]|jgi:leader peptidase (prepilin peptidase)/N-methyltransferase|nr:hypothetical protein [Lachnospiraceae bacterium]